MPTEPAPSAPPPGAVAAAERLKLLIKCASNSGPEYVVNDAAHALACLQSEWPDV